MKNQNEKSELKITKGDWMFDRTGVTILADGTEVDQSYTISTDKTFMRKAIARLEAIKSKDDGLNCCHYSDEETKANAIFIAEAGTVANQCGLTPKQLLMQRDELILELFNITAEFDRIVSKQNNGITLFNDTLNSAKALLRKHIEVLEEIKKLNQNEKSNLI